MDKLIALNLKTKSGIFKLGSVIRGDDGSYYVIYTNNNWFKKTNASSVTPIKYHTMPQVREVGLRLVQIKREQLSSPRRSVSQSTP
jgi:hypothetical protein